MNNFPRLLFLLCFVVTCLTSTAVAQIQAQNVTTAQPQKEILTNSIVIVILFFVFGITASAQSGLPKSEIGGHLSISRQYQLYSGTRFDTTDTQIGGGARYTYNFNSAFAAEGEVTIYPQKQRQKVFGLLGLKAGKRTERVGYFFKLRPGFFKYEESIACPAVLGANCPPTAKTTNFALDIGGVIEMYPSKRTLLRLDVGSVITSVSGVRRNNLQVNLGVGFRF